MKRTRAEARAHTRDNHNTPQPASGLPQISKLDRRYKPARSYPAVETEALGQRVIMDILRRRLDQLLTVPLADVQVRESAEREGTRRRLA